MGGGGGEGEGEEEGEVAGSVLDSIEIARERTERSGKCGSRGMTRYENK